MENIINNVIESRLSYIHLNLIKNNLLLSECLSPKGLRSSLFSVTSVYGKAKTTPFIKIYMIECDFVIFGNSDVMDFKGGRVDFLQKLSNSSNKGKKIDVGVLKW